MSGGGDEHSALAWLRSRAHRVRSEVRFAGAGQWYLLPDPRSGTDALTAMGIGSESHRFPTGFIDTCVMDEDVGYPLQVLALLG